MDSQHTTVDRQCPICQAQPVNLVYQGFPGYIEATFYDIFACLVCGTRFVLPGELNPALYEQLYENHDAHGYERYYAYAHAVRRQRAPLDYLAEQEGTYAPVRDFLKGKGGLDILEVGSGYGYLTYSLNAAGHRAVGVEWSQQAVDFARQQFGDLFWRGELADFASDRKYDLVVATELIEHLADPAGFVARCFELLKEDGALLVTTPNRDYHPHGIWQTDLPPVHTVWLGRLGCRALAARFGLTVDFLEGGYDAASENRLAIYLLTRRNTVPRHRLTAAGRTPAGCSARLSSLASRFIKLVALWWPVRKVCNRMAAWLSREPRMLCAVFTRGPLA